MRYITLRAMQFSTATATVTQYFTNARTTIAYDKFGYLPAVRHRTRANERMTNEDVALNGTVKRTSALPTGLSVCVYIYCRSVHRSIA